MIRVGIIDDHEMVHFALQGILKDDKEISLVAATTTGRDGLQMLRSVPLDVVLLDLELPDISGLQVADRLKKFYPNINIVVLTSAHHLFFVEHLLQLGVRGYITKASSPQDLILAIKKAVRNQRWFSEDVISKLSLERIQSSFPKPLMQLTTLEKEVMLKMIRGEDFQGIADSLCMSKKTAYDYGERLLRKLNVKNKVELTLLAVNFGFIDMDRFK
jgi:two-component system, NarL family, invasion response regulator UvrY